jgi:hypothetical protein
LGGATWFWSFGVGGLVGGLHRLCMAVDAHGRWIRPGHLLHSIIVLEKPSLSYHRQATFDSGGEVLPALFLFNTRPRNRIYLLVSSLSRLRLFPNTRYRLKSWRAESTPRTRRLDPVTLSDGPMEKNQHSPFISFVNTTTYLGGWSWLEVLGVLGHCRSVLVALGWLGLWHRRCIQMRCSR